MTKTEMLQKICMELNNSITNESKESVQLIALFNDFVKKILTYSFVEDYVRTNTYFSMIRDSIDIKIKQNTTQLNELYENFGENRTVEENLQSVTLRHKYDKLLKLRKEFENICKINKNIELRQESNDFDYVNNLQAELKESYEKIENECILIIKQTQAYKFINHPLYGETEDALEFIFEYYHNMDLRKEVKNYNLKLEKGFHIYEIAMQEASKYYEYLTIINNLQEIIRKYLKLKTIANDKKISDILTAKATNERKLANISTNGFQGLVNKSKISKIESDIEANKAELEKIKAIKPTIIELEKQIKEKGLSGVLKEYYRDDLNKNGTPEERAAYFIKKHLTPTSFDGITDEINKAYDNLKICKERAKEVKDETLKNVPSIHKLVGINFNELKSIENLSNEKVYGLDPRLAIYILIFIRNIKNENYINLSNIVDLSDQEKNELLIKSDEMIHMICQKYQDEIINIEKTDINISSPANKKINL